MKRRTLLSDDDVIVRRDDIKSEQSTDLTFDDCVERFLADRRSRDISPETIKFYRERFSNYKNRFKDIYGRYPPRAVLRKHIDDLVSFHTITRQNKLSGIQPLLRALKAYSIFLVKEGIESENAFDDYVIRKPKPKSMATFSSTDVKKLLAQPNVKTFVGLRDYVIILTLLDTGIRIRELVSLNVDDVNFSDNFISVKGKNGHLRNVPLSTQLKPTLKKYVKVRGISSTEALFISSLDRRFQRRSIQDRLSIYGRRASIDKVRVSPHTFSHTFAKMYLRSGGNIFVLQDILGHQTLEMVRVYVRLFSKDLYDDHRKHNPLGHI